MPYFLPTRTQDTGIVSMAMDPPNETEGGTTISSPSSDRALRARKRLAEDVEKSLTRKPKMHKMDQPWVNEMLAMQREALRRMADMKEEMLRMTEKIDNLTSSVNSKLAEMDGKMQVANTRIQTLQEGRRDALLSTLNPSPSTPTTPSVPHYTSSRAPPPPTQAPRGLGAGTMDMSAFFGLK